MDDKLILEQSKELTLSYLKNIGANIEHTEGLYNIEIPKEYESVFGGIRKRITFDNEVASLHNCELVVPGSNFLSTILSELRKNGPVIYGHLPKQAISPSEYLKKIETQNCQLILNESKDEFRTAIRFYFFINVKSIKNVSMLRWVDVDLENLRILDLPMNIELEPSIHNIKYEKDDQRIDHCHVNATQFLQNEIEPLAMKYVDLTRSNLERDTNSLEQVVEKRIKEIHQDIDYQKSKLNEFDRKIMNAKHSDTRRKYFKQKLAQEERIKKAEEQSSKQIQSILNDKESQSNQIEKRYRPIINLALIAGMVFSYSVSICKMTLRNEFIEKKIDSEFVDPTQSLDLNCDVCHNQPTKVHLCNNSHLCCSNCQKICIKCQRNFCINCSGFLNSCYICKEVLCEQCTSKCEHCSEIVCDNHTMMCTHCEERICHFCSDICDICSQKFCNKFFKTCNKCHRQLCEIDSVKCSICNSNFCFEDIGNCSICKQNFCENDSSSCVFCEQIYCSSCIRNRICNTCSNMKEVTQEESIIREFILTNSEYDKYRKFEFSHNEKFIVLKLKKFLSNKIIVCEKNTMKIILEKKG